MFCLEGMEGVVLCYASMKARCLFVDNTRLEQRGPTATPGLDEQHIDYLPFFVYGTLKPGHTNYAAYLGGRTTREEAAILREAALITDELYPYLMVDPDIVSADDQVRGILVTVEPEHYIETLHRLDWLEDYKPMSALSLYLRISRVVETASGPVDAWIYVAGPQVLANVRSGRLRRIAGGMWPEGGHDQI